MNNDISANLKYFNAQKQNKAVNGSKSKEEPVAELNKSNSDFRDSMAFLGSMGCAQVKMDNASLCSRIANSVAEFKENPDLVNLHTSFCDDLIEKGYSLENAVRCTDAVFRGLKNEETYK